MGIETISLVAALAVMGAVLIVREWQNWKDRKDLIDRVMSIDFREFKRYSPDRPKPGPGLPGRMTDEEMAKEEQRRKG